MKPHLRMVALVPLLLLVGCAAPSGKGDAVAINSSPGAVVINGDVTIQKQFGGDCTEATSGVATTQDSQSSQGGSLGVDVATRGGDLGLEAGAALVSSLAAQDTCGPGDDDGQEDQGGSGS